MAGAVVKNLTRGLPGASTGGDYLVTTVLGSLWAAELLEAKGIRRLSTQDRDLCSSDTLFVLGSGPDISKLSDAHWRVIAEHDSVSFNSWTRHQFVPTFYFPQTFSHTIINELVSARYSAANIIVRGDLTASLGLDSPGLTRLLGGLPAERLRFVPEFPVARIFEEVDPAATLNFLEALGLWRHGHVPKIMPKFRATIGLAAAFGYTMGYRKIVICGFDPRTPGHFWDNEAAKEPNKLFQSWQHLKSGPWPQEAKWYARNTVSSYINAIDQSMRVSGVGAVFSGNIKAPNYNLQPYWAC